MSGFTDALMSFSFRWEVRALWAFYWPNHFWVQEHRADCQENANHKTSWLWILCNYNQSCFVVCWLCYPVRLLFLLKLAFNDLWLTRFPVLERKELRNINNINCSTKAGGDALSTLAYSMGIKTHIHILAHIPDRHTQNSLAWQQDPVKQINKLLIRGGKCDWPLSSKAMIYCACHHHLKVTPTLGQWDRPK